MIFTTYLNDEDFKLPTIGEGDEVEVKVTAVTEITTVALVDGGEDVYNALTDAAKAELLKQHEWECTIGCNNTPPIGGADGSNP